VVERWRRAEQPIACCVLIAAQPELEAIADQTRGFVDATRAPNTVRAYASDWRDFLNFCDARGLQALPASPEAVAGADSELVQDVLYVLGRGSLCDYQAFSDVTDRQSLPHKHRDLELSRS
jgi:hypothetical protein